MPKMGVQVLAIGIFVPLHKDTLGFIVGHIISTISGLQVFPGVIDNDYRGEIKVMVPSPKKYCYNSFQTEICSITTSSLTTHFK